MQNQSKKLVGNILNKKTKKRLFPRIKCRNAQL